MKHGLYKRLLLTLNFETYYCWKSVLSSVNNLKICCMQMEVWAPRHALYKCQEGQEQNSGAVEWYRQSVSTIAPRVVFRAAGLSPIVTSVLLRTFSAIWRLASSHPPAIASRSYKSYVPRRTKPANCCACSSTGQCNTLGCTGKVTCIQSRVPRALQLHFWAPYWAPKWSRMRTFYNSIWTTIDNPKHLPLSIV